MEIEEISSSTSSDQEDNMILKNLISKLNRDTELIIVKSDLSSRICTSASSYSNLPQTHMIMVNIFLKLRLKISSCFK